LKITTPINSTLSRKFLGLKPYGFQVSNGDMIVMKTSEAGRSRRLAMRRKTKGFMNTTKVENGNELLTPMPSAMRRRRKNTMVIKLVTPGRGRAARIGRTLRMLGRDIPVTRPGGCEDVFFKVKISSEKTGPAAPGPCPIADTKVCEANLQ
jgi:hypothetical protein